MTDALKLIGDLEAVLTFYAKAWQWDGENPATTEPSGDLRDDLGARAHDFLRDFVPDLRAQAAELERVKEALKRFEHIHVGPGDECRSCGLDIRNSIHKRAP